MFSTAPPLSLRSTNFAQKIATTPLSPSKPHFCVVGRVTTQLAVQFKFCMHTEGWSLLYWRVTVQPSKHSKLPMCTEGWSLLYSGGHTTVTKNTNSACVWKGGQYLLKGDHWAIRTIRIPHVYGRVITFIWKGDHFYTEGWSLFRWRVIKKHEIRMITMVSWWLHEGMGDHN